MAARIVVGIDRREVEMATMRQLSETDEIALNQQGHGERSLPSTPVVRLEENPVYPVLVGPDQKQAGEHFAVLRARLLEARARSGVSTILLSSPQQQEGKSFTCLNLAISLAQLRTERVLLVDADLRVRGMSNALGLDRGTGLCDYLRERASFEGCVRPTTLPYLHFVSSGDIADQDLPAALEGCRWPMFLRRAKEEFSLVIVDSVPMSAPIVDFELLLHACDAVLLVVFLHKTTREALDIASQKSQGKLLGVVVNNTQCEVSSNYYSYYMRKKSKER